MLFFQQKNVSFGFLSLALNPCHPFSRWASLACRPLSLFLCLSLALYSKFVDMAIYLSHVNTLDNTDRETISAFCFRLYWLFCCLYFTRRRWLYDFRPKKPLVAFGLPYLLIELFYIGICLWCGRTVSRSGGRFTVTWLPNFLGGVGDFIFLPMVFHWRASRSKAPLLESSVRSEFTANL